MSRHTENDRFIDELYRKHAGLMFTTALHFGVSDALAEDIVASGLLSLSKKADLLREFNDRQLKAYIVTTIRRAAIDRLNRDALRHRKETQSDLWNLHQNPAPANDERLLVADELQAVLEIIERLPARQRACVKLRFLLDKSVKQIALETDMSEGSVRKYISRARKRIRSELKKLEEGQV